MLVNERGAGPPGGAGEDAAPTLSVVMPAFNAERYIGRAIESILDQTYADLELIIYMDAPTDDTVEVARRHAEHDDRVRILENDQNVGVSVGLNRAVATARGSFIGRMDADDIAVPNRFERQMELIQSNPEIAIVGSDAVHINSDDEVLGLSIAGPRSIEDFHQRRQRGELTLVLDGTAVMRREVFDLVGGYDPEMPIAQEVDLHSRMAAHGAVVAIDEPLLLYRLHPDSRVATRFFEGRNMHRFVLARDRGLQRGETPLTFSAYLENQRSMTLLERTRIRLSDLAHYHYRTSGVYLAEGRKGAALVSLAKAFAANPRFVTQRAWQRRLSPEARRLIKDTTGKQKERVS